MDRLLPDMQLLVAVARSGSFGRAAAALGMPGSTLSRRIAALEESLGVRLLNRSTRKVELTEDGEAYFRRIEHIVDDALAAHDEVRDRKDQPSGLVRVSMPHGVAADLGMSWLADFATLHRDVRFELNTEPTHIDLIGDRFDVAIRLGPIKDSGFIVRRVGSFSRFLYAAPSYLAQHGTPEQPRDLQKHQCIRLKESPHNWTLTRDGQSETVLVDGQFISDAMLLARPLAIAGHGIIQILSQRASAEEQAGDLIRVLPEWHIEAVPLLIITPTRLMPRRTRLFVEFVANAVQRIPA